MNPEEFVVEDYKLALDYLQGQFQRLWQRFNFFLSVQLALFGFVGFLAFKERSLAGLPLVGALGIFVSVLWYIVAAQDRFLVFTYRRRVESAAEKIAGIATLNTKDYGRTFIGVEAPSGFESPGSWYSWYLRPLSITRLPVWVSLLLTLVWLALLLKGVEWLGPPLPAAPLK
jgi:hypothetical protein